MKGKILRTFSEFERVLHFPPFIRLRMIEYQTCSLFLNKEF